MAKTEEQTLWEKKEAFIMADAEYKQLCEKVKSLHKKSHDLRQAGRMALQNINRFLLAEELASKQSYKFEDASEEVNTILDDFTMECGECWFYKYDSTSDFLLNQALEYSQVPAGLFKEIRKNEQDIKIATQYKDDLRNRLYESFDLALKESNENHKKEENK
tara:strand:+ start:231 stop:716 length:486 start_codon:yes stop_codon:yes gene_type:complete